MFAEKMSMEKRLTVDVPITPWIHAPVGWLKHNSVQLVQM